jgi:DnaJ like chaperone protein
LSEEDRAYAEILELEENAIEDFDAIKAIYRKRIAQYHPDKVLAMGPEIREIAEQKAKEINEAYEYFRAKSKRIEPQ